MVKRIIAIGGEPGTGKTKLVKDMMKDFTLTPFSYGLVRGEYDKYKNVYFIGVYDNSVFQGTDKLSMAVQPHFIKFLNYTDGIVIFEGDRLFNNKLFSTEYPFIKIVLTASKETLDERHKQRGDNQTERFLNSRTTKINNIIKTNPDIILLNNEGDNDENINIIKKYIYDIK